MNPSRRWIRGSSRFCFATRIVAASRRFNDSESVTRASESRNASIAARSAGDWAGRRVAGPTSRANRTRDRRIVQLYPASHLRVRPSYLRVGPSYLRVGPSNLRVGPRDSHAEAWARRNTVLKHTRVLQDSAVPSPPFQGGKKRRRHI